jgi:hypothetical protein
LRVAIRNGGFTITALTSNPIPVREREPT